MSYKFKGKLNVGDLIINDRDGNTGQVLTRDSDGVVKLKDAQAVSSDSYGGFYHIFSSESISIPLGRILYTSRYAVTEGIVNIRGILEVNY